MMKGGRERGRGRPWWKRRKVCRKFSHYKSARRGKHDEGLSSSSSSSSSTSSCLWFPRSFCSRSSEQSWMGDVQSQSCYKFVFIFEVSRWLSARVCFKLIIEKAGNEQCCSPSIQPNSSALLSPWVLLIFLLLFASVPSTNDEQTLEIELKTLSIDFAFRLRLNCYSRLFALDVISINYKARSRKAFGFLATTQAEGLMGLVMWLKALLRLRQGVGTEMQSQIECFSCSFWRNEAELSHWANKQLSPSLHAKHERPSPFSLEAIFVALITSANNVRSSVVARLDSALSCLVLSQTSQVALTPWRRLYAPSIVMSLRRSDVTFKHSSTRVIVCR